jgi:hypothetical protein
VGARILLREFRDCNATACTASMHACLKIERAMYAIRHDQKAATEQRDGIHVEQRVATDKSKQ